MRASVLRATGSVASLASCLVLFGGVASAQTVTITDTGRNSDNKISFENKCIVDVENNTHLSFWNDNTQTATSGDAKVHNNDDVGSVTTGNAHNSNSTSVSLSVSNDTDGCGSEEEESTPPTGGQGGGGETVTPTGTTTSVAVGGSGGGVATVQQVAAVPVGGVGAGTGSQSYLAGLTAITLGSLAWAFKRLQGSFKSQF